MKYFFKSIMILYFCIVFFISSCSKEPAVITKVHSDNNRYQKYFFRIIDSCSRNPVHGANVVFTYNGTEKKIKSKTDPDGYIIMNSLPFTEEHDKKGQIEYSVSAFGYNLLKGKSPCYQKELCLVKKINYSEPLRIVLSWGKRPKNLVSHLWFKDIHLFHDGQTGRMSGLNSTLDRNDTNSYGPEVITIKRLKGENYIYAIHDYTNKNNLNSKQLSLSDAMIYVYSYHCNEPIKKYSISPNNTGNIWFVFYINEHGEFVKINKFFSINSGSNEILPILIENK